MPPDHVWGIPLRQINVWEKFPAHTVCIVEAIPQTRSDLALDAALRVMAPLVEWLLKEGVTHTRLSNALKQTMDQTADAVVVRGRSGLVDAGAWES